MNQPVNNADNSTSEIVVYKVLHWALYHVWFQNTVQLYQLFRVSLQNYPENVIKILS